MRVYNMDVLVVMDVIMIVNMIMVQMIMKMAMIMTAVVMVMIMTVMRMAVQLFRLQQRLPALIEKHHTHAYDGQPGKHAQNRRNLFGNNFVLKEEHSQA
jgi:hypothetical protein